MIYTQQEGNTLKTYTAFDTATTAMYQLEILCSRYEDHDPVTLNIKSVQSGNEINMDNEKAVSFWLQLAESPNNSLHLERMKIAGEKALNRINELRKDS